jgi:hypothetical protein
MTFPAQAGRCAVLTGRRAGCSGSGRPVGGPGIPYGTAVRHGPDEVLGVG